MIWRQAGRPILTLVMMIALAANGVPGVMAGPEDDVKELLDEVTIVCIESRGRSEGNGGGAKVIQHDDDEYVWVGPREAKDCEPQFFLLGRAVTYHVTVAADIIFCTSEQIC